MKITAKQIRKLNAIYNDYMSIDDDVSLRKRKLSLSDYNAFPDIFKAIQKYGSTETFVSSIAEYFKKHGFNVTEKSVNFLISLWYKSDISSGSNSHIEEVFTMMLSIRTYKIRKSDGCSIHDTYRYTCFDSDYELEGKTFEEKFNHAFDVLKEKIQQDRNNNDMNLYGPIVIADVFLS